jgi:hypothetical protein
MGFRFEAVNRDDGRSARIVYAISDLRRLAVTRDGVTSKKYYSRCKLFDQLFIACCLFASDNIVADRLSNGSQYQLNIRATKTCIYSGCQSKGQGAGDEFDYVRN